MNTGWNQSPPRFAADLTTCADLNGIANNRELGDADCLCNGSRSLRHPELEDRNIKGPDKVPVEVGMGVKGSQKGTSNVPTETIEYRDAHLSTGPCTRTTTPVSIENPAGFIKSWGTWLLSVIATSTLLSFMSGNMPSFNVSIGKNPVVLTMASKARLGSQYLCADHLQAKRPFTASIREARANPVPRNRIITSHSMSAVYFSSCSYPRLPVPFRSLSSSFPGSAFRLRFFLVPSISVPVS
jgi:hypothetical protein